MSQNLKRMARPHRRQMSKRPDYYELKLVMT